MTSLIHSCQKRALIPLKFEVVFNYDTFFKVAQSYPHDPKLAQLTVLYYSTVYETGQEGNGSGGQKSTGWLGGCRRHVCREGS